MKKIAVLVLSILALPLQAAQPTDQPINEYFIETRVTNGDKIERTYNVKIADKEYDVKFFSRPTLTFHGVEVASMQYSHQSINSHSGDTYKNIGIAFHHDGQLDIIYTSDTCGKIRYFGQVPQLNVVHELTQKDSGCLLEFAIRKVDI